MAVAQHLEPLTPEEALVGRLPVPASRAHSQPHWSVRMGWTWGVFIRFKRKGSLVLQGTRVHSQSHKDQGKV